MKNSQKMKIQKQNRRRQRSRAKLVSNNQRPRLVVSRSLKNISCQLIDDRSGKVLFAASSQQLKNKTLTAKDMTSKVAVAYETGRLLGEQAFKQKIISCVFDRSGYKYHGRVKAVAEGARAAGLKF